MAGMHGNIGPNVNTNKCDVLIAIGMRFDDRVTGDTSKYAPQAKIVHIDIDPSEFNKTYAPQCLCSACENGARQTHPDAPKKRA